MNESMGLKEFVEKCWDLDASGWQFTIKSDQWWGIKARNEDFGTFTAVSSSYIDVEEMLAKLYMTMKMAIEFGDLDE